MVDKKISSIESLLTDGNIAKKTDLVTSLEMLANDQFIEGKSIFNNEQVLGITMMNWAGQVYDIPFLRNFVNTFPKYRISGDNGRGRKEIIEIAKAIQQQNAEEHERLKQLLGGTR